MPVPVKVKITVADGGEADEPEVEAGAERPVLHVISGGDGATYQHYQNDAYETGEENLPLDHLHR